MNDHIPDVGGANAPREHEPFREGAGDLRSLVSLVRSLQNQRTEWRDRAWDAEERAAVLEARLAALGSAPVVQRTLDWWDDSVSSEDMSARWGNGSFNDDERLISEALRAALEPSDSTPEQPASVRERPDGGSKV